MGRTKGFRVTRKAAEDFLGFTPPKVTDKIKAHPNLLALHNELTKPLEPLKYKLQDLPSPDTTFVKPLGNTQHLPFQVFRTHLGNLPVYTEFRNNRSKKVTVLRKVIGDTEELKQELAKVVSNSPISEKVGRLEIKGLHSQVVKLWLRRLGF